MNIIRKGAVALAALAALGTSAGFVVAAETASAAPAVVTYTSQEVGPRWLERAERGGLRVQPVSAVGVRAGVSVWPPPRR